MDYAFREAFPVFATWDARVYEEVVIVSHYLRPQAMLEAGWTSCQVGGEVS